MNKQNELIGVCRARGYQAAGVAAGIKASGKKDVALIVSEKPAAAAGVFTTNIVKAASVQISQKNLLSGTARAVLMTSGNANAANGDAGIKAVEELCALTAKKLGCTAQEILAAQTGLIGIPFNTNAGLHGIEAAVASLSKSQGLAACEAIMTTDTKPKYCDEVISVAGKEVVVAGMAKGAAMLAPSMATMLALVVSDASATAEVLKSALSAAMEDSFHSMIVDGCRSTNDTVFLLANGAAESDLIDSIEHPSYPLFASAVAKVCCQLAQKMAGDAEGATKFLTMNVKGARNKNEARMAAKSVVGSALVKCSLAGENAYWGRVISELGASGAQFDPNKVEIRYGDFIICKNGVAFRHDEAAVDAYMKNRDIVITASIGEGDGEATAYGCDLTHAYVDENMGKS